MKWNKRSWIVLVFVVFIIVVIGIRFWSYFSLAIPLGYDHGIYRAFFMMLQDQLPYLHFWQLPAWVKATYEPFSWLFYIVAQRTLWLSADMLLLRWVGAIHILISVFIYLVLRKYNKTVALFWIVLYLTSIIQYEVFRWGYLKQMMGVLFILTAYYLIEKKSYRLLIPILTWLFTVNRAGGIFFLVSFLVYKIIVAFREKSWTWKDIRPLIIASWLSLVVYRPVVKEQIFAMFWPMFGQAFIWEASGTFFDKQTYSMYNLIFIGLAVWGCIYWRSKQLFKKIPLELVWFIVGMVRVGIQLFFYNRMLGYLDIFVIILAAYGLSYLVISSNKLWKSVGIWLYLLQLCFFCIFVFNTNFPLIVPQEFASIQKIPSLIPATAKIMVTDKKYSAFLMGYGGHNIIARWLFDLDPWTTTQWQYRHNVDGTTKCKLLDALGKDKRPQYLRIGSLQVPTSLSGATCLKQLLWDTHYWFYLVNYPDA